MPRWASCQECSNRYDTAAWAFCPRCGATARAPDAPAPPSRFAPAHPRRRRVQMGGAVLLFLGLSVAGVSGALAVLRGPDLAAIVVDMASSTDAAGGDLHIHVAAAGRAAHGVTVQVNATDGRTLAVGAVGESGWFNTTLGRPAATIALQSENATFHRRAFVLAGDVAEVRLDVAADAADDPGWIGLESLGGFGLYVALGVLATGLLAALAGGCAIALRAPEFAAAGSVPLVAATGYLLFLFGELGLLMLLGLEVAALVMVVSGRSAFRRRR